MSQVEIKEDHDNVIIDSEGLEKEQRTRVKSIDKSNIIDYGKILEKKAKTPEIFDFAGENYPRDEENLKSMTFNK